MLSQPVFKNRSMAAALWCQIKVVINGSVRYSQIPGTVYLQEEVCICVRPISANFVFSIVWGRFRPGVSQHKIVILLFLGGGGIFVKMRLHLTDTFSQRKVCQCLFTGL